MQKIILDMLQITIVVKMGYSLVRWAIRGTKSRKKSITSKAMKLVSNRVHHILDNALKKQKDVISSSKQKKVELPSNVIPFKKTK